MPDLHLEIIDISFSGYPDGEAPIIKRIEASVEGERHPIAELAVIREKDCWRITHVGTLEKWRGQGVARQMLDYARTQLGDVIHSQSLAPDGEGWAAAVEGPPKLSLELLCGANDVDPSHPGYFDPSEQMTHPSQERAKQLLEAHHIHVDINGHRDHGISYSDAYVRCHPHQLKQVAQILDEVGHPGDILDVNVDLTPGEIQMVREQAQVHGWIIEGLSPELSALDQSQELQSLPSQADNNHGIR